MAKMEVIETRVSPFATVNAKDVQEEADKLGNKSVAELQTQADEVFGKLQKAYEQSENGADYSKIAVFGEGEKSTAMDTMKAIHNAHVELAALNHVISSKQALENAVNEGLPMNNGGGAPATVPAHTRVSVSFGDRAIKAFQDEGARL